MDLFVSALDNVAARNTLERINQMYSKFMIDGGTEGLEGTQENFIPLVTNEYLSTGVRFISIFYILFLQIFYTETKSLT
jgi:molybdopterin/thiamine biosynthesis adenylyltransferase